MGKPLSEMTLEELWQLFPIILEAPKPCWQQWYKEEAEALEPLLPPGTRVSHIGSTAISGIWAKPIVDILVEIPVDTNLAAVGSVLPRLGYRCMNQSDNRHSYNKGYTESGFAERVFHLHLRLAGDCDELYFRDYLNDHPTAAQEYEQLKLGLWKQYEHDRDGYTAAKASFVHRCTQAAKQQYGSRWDMNAMETE